MTESSLPRVFVLGASTTIHFGPYLERELAGRFHYDRKRDTSTQRAEDNLDIPQGASGGDSAMILAYLRDRRLHDPIPADILLLSCGLHDIKTDPATGTKQVPPAQFETNLRLALDECRAMRLLVAWMRIAPVVDHIHNTRCPAFHRCDADVDACNSIADRVMTRGHAAIIDFHAFCRPFLPHALIDHIHYDEDTRHKQAVFLAGELDRIWKSRA